MINSDWEGPWVTADHAFDIMKKGIDGGDRIFEALSAYDDYLAYVVKKKDYEPGNTLALIAPFLIAFGLDNSFLVSKAKDNANFIAGSIKALEMLSDLTSVNIISTSYHQYVHYTAYLAKIPEKNTYCTHFPIDDYSSEISFGDKELVMEMANTILAMPPLNIDTDAGADEIDDDTVLSIEKLDEFFWELLPSTGYSKVLDEVRPIGGSRKYEAVLQALEKEGLGLECSATIGDSITDWKMLKKTKDAGGLALSFNGNEYAVSNCNVAVMSGNCMVTALIVDVFEKGGIDMVKVLASYWGWDAVKQMRIKGYVSEPIYNAFRQAFTAVEFPQVVWVTPENIDVTTKVSKQYRKAVRGTQVGSLG